MESPILPTSRTNCISGIQRPILNVSEPTTQQQSPCPSNPTILQVSPRNSRTGELSKVLDPENQPQNQPSQENDLPCAELIQASNVPPPRTCTLTYEEFYQWRQVLGQFRQEVIKIGSNPI